MRNPEQSQQSRKNKKNNKEKNKLNLRRKLIESKNDPGVQFKLATRDKRMRLFSTAERLRALRIENAIMTL
jgi:hypothetical protein